MNTESVPRFVIGEETEHWHTWSCGCKSRVTPKLVEIVYCREDCLIYLAFIEGREVQHT